LELAVQIYYRWFVFLFLFFCFEFSFAQNQYGHKSSSYQEDEKEETILQSPLKDDSSLKASVKKVIDNVTPTVGAIGREDPFKSPFIVPQGTTATSWPSSRKVSVRKIRLVAVFADERAEAIIELNGKSYTVHVGSSIEGRRVKNISEEKVILTKGKKIYILPLGKPVPLD
jgi:hypothetical protein